MSEAAAPAAPAAAAPKKSRLPMILIAVVNVLVLGGLGAFVWVSRGAASSTGHGGEHAEHGDEDEDEDADEEHEGDDEEGDEEEGEGEEEHELGPLVEFESIVVNTADDGDHFVKITFQLEVRDEEHVEHVETRMAPFRDRVLTHLTTMTIAEASGPDHVAHMREALLGLAREVFGRRTIRNLYFTEFLVQ